MSNTNNAPPGPDCFACKHFYVTWDPNQPRGCRAFGFKTANFPATVVLNSSGKPCQLFEIKQTPTSTAQTPKGWQA